MKKIIKIFVPVIFFCLLSYTVSAQNQDITGWQEARWGMSETEIIKIFGSSLTKLNKQEIYAGMHTDFVINNYVIENIKFRVSFRMSDATNKLVEVALAKSDIGTSQDNSLFNNLASLLIRKYGQSQRETNDNDKQTIEWTFPSTSIILSYSFNKTFKMDLLSIRYISNKGGDINKL
ncbi:MAG: hypothetical protein ACYDEQ_12545 [Desulfocucumaceae bacterium]